MTNKEILEAMKIDMCKQIMDTDNFPQLKNTLKYIHDNWEISEDNKFYS